MFAWRLVLRFFVFQQLANKLDSEGRYFFLNAVANQLRYPNQHTHYFSCVLLYLFAEAQSEMVQEQITRILLERLIVHRPHPVSNCRSWQALVARGGRILPCFMFLR